MSTLVRWMSSMIGHLIWQGGRNWRMAGSVVLHLLVVSFMVEPLYNEPKLRHCLKGVIILGYVNSIPPLRENAPRFLSPPATGLSMVRFPRHPFAGEIIILSFLRKGRKVTY